MTTLTIVGDASRGAGRDYAFEDITYIFSQENPFVMLLTTDRYALPTGIRVGDSLERLQTLYPSMRRIEEANDLYVSLDSVDRLLNYDSYYTVVGMLKPSEYNLYQYIPGPNIFGLGFYVRVGVIVGICNTFPTAD